MAATSDAILGWIFIEKAEIYNTFSYLHFDLYEV